VPINAPQAPVTTTASVAAPASGAAPVKRVQVTLDAAHPLTATTPVKAPEQDDASTATKHASTSELGA
jgi:hypothetical protein